MHRGHDHDHDGGGAPGPGHNHAAPLPRPVQWQTPHLAHGHDGRDDHDHRGEPDLDLVEKAFVAGFAAAPDPTSFLRLAQVPFEGTAADGTRLVLLRVETDQVTDVGAVMPHVGGGSFRYDPLPAAMVSHRRRARFVYFDGHATRALALADARELAKGG